MSQSMPPATTARRPIGPWIFCVAPMMEWTDRHCRVFHRTLTRHARLYTEMVTAAAVIHGARDRLLGFDPIEHPVAVQLGGADPRDLAKAAAIAAGFGYDEINLNVGCPSDRVQGGRFGACLMREPRLVAECVTAMKAAVAVPVTVKCRIGVDEQAPEEALFAMTDALVGVGVDALIVHARKAWLKGLSPKENREVPPLDYAIVRRLKAAHPALPVVVNGGIVSLAQAREHLVALDGVMVGRAAYQAPDMLLDVDRSIFGIAVPESDAAAALARYRPYITARLAEGVRLSAMTRHMLGLFAGRPGARAYRRHLAMEAVKPGAGLGVLDDAMAFITSGVRQAA